MVILGLSAFVHDSGACLIVGGQLVANVEEERLDRIKHTSAFPVRAIDFVLKQGGIRLADVDVIAYNWNPYKSACVEVIKLLAAPIIYYQVRKYARPPKNFRSIAASLRLKKIFTRLYPGEFSGRIIYVNHHLAHAASSYYLSPFNRQNADVIVADGHGEDCSTSVYSLRDNTFTLKWKAPVWNSLGILYSTFTNFLGFDSYQEGKTMALAAFGRDSFREHFERIIELRPDGQYVIPNQKYLGLWYYSETGLGREFGPKRERGECLEQRHFDIAFSMQNRIKEAVLHMVRHASTVSGDENLCLSGGLFLNCDINSEILASGAYRQVFVPPFPSDSGGAVGAGLHAAFVSCGETPEEVTCFSPYLGPEYSVKSPRKKPAAAVKAPEKVISTPAKVKAPAKVSPLPGKTLTDPATGMEFVFVKGDCFRMGDVFETGDRDEKPVHEVCLDDYYLGKYEVTQKQWETIMKSNPAGFRRRLGCRLVAPASP